ncbi:hypothetical protein OG252_51950 [Streptomyces sp. NBC_01352]|uniref:hypothetical protein n=1 Tax=Streptomyces sp. NBC_01352 TaxID=2903834 RepID=UPI002E378DDD|nr:hypothetical protein [Streptomyces sp. NBC_01352]
MTLPLIVALALGGVGVYIAYRNPRLGAAILVGLGIVTVLYLIWDKDPSVFQTTVPSTVSTAPTQSPPADQTGAPSSAAPSTTPPASSPVVSPPVRR